ncbi:MAG: patatin-like phospholipase family protein, partial [Actinomycetota bacterium]|nr:patatin-like phospholipase family protein [Actinomycetota bacterium]
RAALDRELAQLRVNGATVVEVEPEDASVEAMGSGDQLNPQHLMPAAVAGRAQGAREADRVRATWSSAG